MIADAIAMGYDPPAPTRSKGADFLVWPECWDAVQLFLKVQTQWRSRGDRVIGLDYGVVLTIADRMYPEGDSMALLEDLRIMEARLLEMITEAAEAG